MPNRSRLSRLAREITGRPKILVFNWCYHGTVDETVATLENGRTVARRAERTVITLVGSEPINAPPRQYLNRLSDLMFVLSRVLNRYAGGTDVLWQQGRNK